jgi:type II secretory pathway pseudopilin PulG
VSPTTDVHHQRARPTRARGQAGVSLIEVLIGIGVMMPMTLAAVTGLLLAVETSAAAEQRQQLEVALTEATENVRSMPYLPCATAEEYQKVYALWSEPLAAKVQDPARPTISSVSHLHREKPVYTPDCSGDEVAQLVVVSVSAGDTEVTGSVVKRDSGARAGNPR